MADPAQRFGGRAPGSDHNQYLASYTTFEVGEPTPFIHPALTQARPLVRFGCWPLMDIGRAQNESTAVIGLGSRCALHHFLMHLA
jgi:hypothetical protein